MRFAELQAAVRDGRVTRFLLVALSLAFIAFFAVIAFVHLRYPYEIEWYEGLMMDHILRVAHGLQIFDKPNVYFSAALYQPLYYYLAAPFVKLFGETYFAGRLLTILCTLVTMAIAARAAYELSERSKLAVVISVGFLCATYVLTDYVQTVVRVDSTYVMFLVLGYYLATRKAALSTVLSALSFAAAYFTKQEAFFFFPAALVWLFLFQKRQALIFAAVLAIALAGGTMLLQASSHGWYSYYVYGMPHAKSQYYGYLRAIAAFPTETLKYWGPSAIILGIFAILVRGKAFALKTGEGLWALALLSAVAQSCAHRGDQMSGNNILHPLCAMLAVVLPYALIRTEQEQPKLARILEWALVIQLLTLIVDPRTQPMLIPTAADQSRGDRFMAYMKSLHGDVVIPAHGFWSTMAHLPTHTHCQVENDVLVMRDSIARTYRADWQSAFAAKRFAAIIWDKSGAHVPDSIPGYWLAGELPDSVRIGSKMGFEIVRPTYLYLPKPSDQQARN